MNATPRPALFIIEAAKGHRQAANGLVRRAVKRAGLQVAAFVPQSEAKSYGVNDARFTVDCTDEQFATLLKIAREMALAEGWKRFPADSYHD